ncbi:MAG: restriction endonuclease subunit S [Burkholderiales bacterium]|nr:restriction endonuclease subunit S [Burkholderiales bacterium]
MTWETIQFDKIITSYGVGKNGLSKKDWSEDDKYPVIGQGADFIEGWTNREDLVINPDSEGLVIYGGHTRRAKYITTPFVPGPNVKILKTPPEIKPRFLFYFLNSAEIPNKGYADHFPLVKRIKVPIPSIKEQERIVALLEQAEELKNKRAEADQKMEELVPALFNDMFGNLSQWPKIKLRDIAIVKIGPFGTQLHKHDYIENGTPIVNPTHIVEGKIIVNQSFTISEEKTKEINQYIMHTGDIVLARRGEMGRSAIVSEKEDGYLCGTGSLFITPTNQINPYFLNTIFSSIQMKKTLEENARGVTMKNLNINIVENICISNPPIELQNQYERTIKELMFLKHKQEESVNKLKELFTAILTKSI